MEINTELFDILGYYEPGFVHMRINTSEELKDLNKLAANPATAQHFSTFFHEYIHFLQNLTTTSGVMRTVFLIDVLKEFIQQVRNDGVAEFKTPLAFTNDYNVQANGELQVLYLGQHKKIDYIRYSHYTVDQVAVADKDGNTKQVPRYTVHYFSQAQQPAKFYFGSACLTEYVAHAIQQRFAPETRHPDVPYLAPELILAKEYPEFGSDTMLIMSLCDAAMMSYHSAQMFFDLIAAMKLQRFVPIEPEDIYDFMNKNFTFHNETESFQVADLFTQQLQTVLYHFNDALKSEIFEPNLRWLDHIIREGHALRTAVPAFFAYLVDDERKLSTLFYDIFARIGSPFMTNEKQQGGFIPPKIIEATGIQPYQLLVFKEILNTFNGQRSCGMYKFCKTHSEKELVNQDCLTAPWKRGSNDDLCPYGQFWKTWGLNGEIPVPGN